MCQMRIILKREDLEEEVLHDAAFLTVTGDGILVNALLDAPVRIQNAVIDSIDFLESKLILKHVSPKGTTPCRPPP